MKKIFTLVCALMLGIGVSQAQVGQGETAVGVNLVYGSEIESLGLGARFQYGIIDHLRGEVGFNYFFEHKHTSWWDVNINAHYLVNLFNENFFIYPLAGLNYTMAKFEGVEKNHIGLNLGAGVEYEISDHWGVNLEYRHTIIRKVDQGVIGLGLNYKF
ncbi:MAG: porin family protein [Muribaculaceae bacterium]|nr:porin family protein [Muribaculaceae bacterium]